MKYWDEPNNGKRKIIEKEITKEDVLHTLAFIKDGYLPDWNYKRIGTNEPVSLPDEYYPLHIAMMVAARAVEAQDDTFFKALNEECSKIS